MELFSALVLCHGIAANTGCLTTWHLWYSLLYHVLAQLALVKCTEQLILATRAAAPFFLHFASYRHIGVLVPVVEQAVDMVFFPSHLFLPRLKVPQTTAPP